MADHRLDEALVQWAASASEEALDSGPTLDDLGGASLVAESADQWACGPQLPYLVAAVAQGVENLADDQATVLAGAVARGLREPHAAWVLADAVDVLCAHPSLAAQLGARLGRDLAAHAEAALAGEVDPAFAQPAVSGLLRLAVAELTTPHRMLALLTEITGSEPPEALERLPILIGVAHDHFSDSSQLLDVLRLLSEQHALSAATRADADFELALAEVRTAFEATDPPATHQHLQRARLRFTELDRNHEARLDARAHAAAVEAVLAFADLVPQAGKSERADAADRLAEAAETLSAATAHLAAWTSGMHQLGWLSARSLAQAAWSRLVSTLRIAQQHLDQPSWYHPADALNDLLEVYLASRSVHAHAGAQGPGLDSLISPSLEAGFLRNQGLLHHLEYALAADPQFTSHPDAQALRDAVQARRLQTDGAAEEGVVRGKVLDGRPRLAALFNGGVTGLRDDLAPHLLDQLERRLQEIAKGYTPTGNARFDAHLESLLAILATSPAWQPDDSHHVTVLVEKTLRFLHDRFDAQADVYGERTAYLGPHPDGGYWPEKAVQDDLHLECSRFDRVAFLCRELVNLAVS